MYDRLRNEPGGRYFPTPFLGIVGGHVMHFVHDVVPVGFVPKWQPYCIAELAMIMFSWRSTYLRKFGGYLVNAFQGELSMSGEFHDCVCGSLCRSCHAAVVAFVIRIQVRGAIVNMII